MNFAARAPRTPPATRASQLHNIATRRGELPEHFPLLNAAASEKQKVRPRMLSGPLQEEGFAFPVAPHNLPGVKGTHLISENDGWETLSTETCFANDYVRVSIEEIRSPARREPRSWTVVHRKRAVVIAPMTAEGEFVLIRQERIPIRASIWEFPAGQIDEETEEKGEIMAVGLRELQEETGYELAEGGELIPLGDYFTSPGFTDECGYLFLARPVRPGADGHAHHESESILDCRAFSARELARMIADNEIRDANTLGIFARLVAHGLLPVERA